MSQLSIILVSYNSRADLGESLPSLLSQADDDVEVLVVDNQSADGTVSWLKHAYPSVRVLCLPENRGYGQAANAGIRGSVSEWVMVSNADTRFQPGALRRLLDAARRYPNALLTPKLVLPDGRINALGNVMHLGGITSCWHYGDAGDRFQGIIPVPLLSGAVILARRDTWLTLGGFDPRIFLYMEDAELSLRARLLGFDLYAVADAVVVHDYHLHLTPQKFQWLEQHRRWTLLKLYSALTLWRLWPALFLTELLTWGFAITKGPGYLKARFNADGWLISHLPELWRAHRKFQRQKRLNDEVVLTWLTQELPWGQLTTSRFVVELGGLLCRLTGLGIGAKMADLKERL
ncbi:MAG: glycosyltransferase family 2 protein [Sulfobacillus thermotolerans]|nr:glycosyltransferase family 2 protein [Sulfobacillus thermotolerans]